MGWWNRLENSFLPDEIGVWQYTMFCSDEENNTLKNKRGEFEVVKTNKEFDIHAHGAVSIKKRRLLFWHTDGKPFFWTVCTSWNGAFKSTEQEWKVYLKHRAKNSHSVIQYVTTQWWWWGETNAEGLVVFDGTGRITINTDFLVTP